MGVDLTCGDCGKTWTIMAGSPFVGDGKKHTYDPGKAVRASVPLCEECVEKRGGVVCWAHDGLVDCPYDERYPGQRLPEPEGPSLSNSDVLKALYPPDLWWRP